MNLLDAMNRALMRSDVTEFAVAAGRPPMSRIGEDYQPLGTTAASEDDIVELLLALGGLRHIDGIGHEPLSWKTTEDALGHLRVSAARRSGVLQVRITKRSAPAAHATEPATPSAVSRHQPLFTAPKAVQRDSIAVRPAERAEPVASATPPSTPAAKRTSSIPRAPVQLAVPEAGPLDRLLSNARSEQASDVHVVAGRPVLFRVAGDLRPLGPVLDSREVEELVLPIVPARLEGELEIHGSCDFALELPELGRFRANVSRHRGGIKASLRLIGRDVPTLASLGLPHAIAEATHHHQGLIVVTGPTGHGKTSTLAAIVNVLNTETSHHVITVEDPVEYVYPRSKALISQREVGTNTRSFAAALKASLREDPDVIVVGELRDSETVRMALAASETGHLVISTMNTPSAAKTIDRLIDMFPPGDQPQVRMSLAGGLRLIVSQRLVKGVDGARVFAAAEILPGNIALWNLIRDAKTYQIPSLQQRGKAMGIVRLDDSLAELVRAGKVTLDEARSYAEAPDELAAVIGGQRPPAAPPLPPRKGP
ncbi:MAG TPA: PilT/PilU family type 4a pilus ATPase [Polyangiaceae bacterium]|nr:PilT/PilU family type 4a pilus ATPase [Polyangiaceae bacterium]